MSKATPGPWSAVDRSDTISIFGPDKRRCVARVQRKFGAAADARLISSAPELRDALRALMHEIDETEAANRQYGVIVGEGPPFGSDGWQNAIALARAALAKAGE